MAHRPILYENLPVNARLADEQGLLRHVCDAVQPTYDEILANLQRLEFVLDPDYCPAEFLDWFQQLVALAPVGDRILGLGVDPEWDPQEKRALIKAAWRYWQTRGTEEGIREALAFWFRWAEARTEPAVVLRLPWGDRPAATPPQWWGYTTRYDAWLTQRWDERQLLGSGDYPQIYHPDWSIVQATEQTWEYHEVFGQPLTETEATPIQSVGSRLGPHAVWEHLTPEPDRWNEIFPGIFDLNEESWDIQARPTVFGWLDGGATDPITLRRSPSTVTQMVYDVEIIGFRYGDVFPFRGIDIVSTPQVIASSAFEINEEILPRTSQQSLESPPFAIASAFSNALLTTGQSLDSLTIQVQNSVSLQSTGQVMVGGEFTVQSVANSAIGSTPQTFQSDSVVVLNSAAIGSTQLTLLGDSVVVRNNLTLGQTIQTLDAASLAIMSVFTASPTTTSQALDSQGFTAQIYSWFYQTIVY